MQPNSINQTWYSPGPVPASQADLRRYLITEFSRISAVLSILSSGNLEKTTAAPARPRDGMIRYADGTEWDPGSGEGVYAYYNSTWNLLG